MLPTDIIRFTDEDLNLFADASGDFNPLHLSAEYARSTPFGERVVFGCLGATAALGRIEPPEGHTPISIDAEFLRPVFLAVEYRIETKTKGERRIAQLFDGTTPVLSVSVRYAAVQHESVHQPTPETESGTLREQPVAHREDEIAVGSATSGIYPLRHSALSRLAQRWAVSDLFLVRLLAWSSYLVGMESPGESALFSRVSLSILSPAPNCSLLYNATVASVDPRFGQIELDVSISNGGTTVASGSCQACIRPGIPQTTGIDPASSQTESLRGKTAVIIGATRGLGAALRQALEGRAGVVYSMSRGGDPSADPYLEVGDALDSSAIRRLRDRVLEEQGKLDFLVCNAFPAILPLRMEPNTADRIAEYIHTAVALTLNPMAEFLDALNRSGGCLIVISSSAVDSPVREWPHYIAAKQAIEGLGQVAALQYRKVSTLIVRPPKLLTAMTNTPLGRIDASDPADMARRIADRLEQPMAAGKTEILDA